MMSSIVPTIASGIAAANSTMSSMMHHSSQMLMTSSQMCWNMITGKNKAIAMMAQQDMEKKISQKDEELDKWTAEQLGKIGINAEENNEIKGRILGLLRKEHKKNDKKNWKWTINHDGNNVSFAVSFEQHTVVFYLTLDYSVLTSTRFGRGNFATLESISVSKVGDDRVRTAIKLDDGSIGDAWDQLFGFLAFTDTWRNWERNERKPHFGTEAEENIFWTSNDGYKTDGCQDFIGYEYIKQGDENK